MFEYFDTNESTVEQEGDLINSCKITLCIKLDKKTWSVSEVNVQKFTLKNCKG